MPLPQLSTGCLTNFLPFIMACDQMAVTLDKHMALRTEVAVLTQRHLQYHKVPDNTCGSVNAKIIHTLKQSWVILPMHNHNSPLLLKPPAAESSCSKSQCWLEGAMQASYVVQEASGTCLMVLHIGAACCAQLHELHAVLSCMSCTLCSAA